MSHRWRRDSEITDWLLAVAATLAVVVVLAAITVMSRPTCPPGADMVHTRSGWYCVVPKVR